MNIRHCTLIGAGAAGKMPALLVAAFTTLQVCAQSVTFYVATNGNDGWSGKLPSADSSLKDGPLATLPGALRYARRHRQSHPADAISVQLRSGIHRLTEPIMLSADDSGPSAERPFTLAAYGTEKPVLSGGRRIANWKRVEGRPDVWQAEVQSVREGKWYFRQLFVNGERRQRARTPNEGFFRIQGPSPQDKPVKLKFKAGEIKKEWAADEDVEVVALLAWADIRMPIRSIDASNNVATLSGNPRPSNKEDNAQYHIENAPDGLDQAGEWYLGRRTGIVTYWARPGEDMSNAEVIAPELQDLIVLRGDFERSRPVRHVAIRGLTFSHTDWTLSTNGYADTQAAVGIRGELLAEAATDCIVENCVFSHLGGYAIELGRGCQRNHIVGNEMFDLGAGGVRIGETAIRESPFDQCHSQTVTDNHIHHLGEVYPPAIGVFILQSGTNRVAHNHIHHLYYTAVSVGWTWGYRESPCRAHRIEFNHMHDIGQSRLSDMGAVYTLGPQKGTVVRNNLIHDVNAFTYGGWGLYTDEGSSEILLENNVVYRTKSAGFHQHYGRENIIRNNIFAFGKENQVMRTRPEAHISFIFTNNIVYHDSGNLLGSNWSNDNYRMDWNIYFDVRHGAHAEGMKFGGASLAEWRKRGHDQHSVIADPHFVSPQTGDFTLRENSPALKLGFQRIDLTKVGVRARPTRPK